VSKEDHIVDHEAKVVCFVVNQALNLVDGPVFSNKPDTRMIFEFLLYFVIKLAKLLFR